jgi:uncharacterized delta-60 repeat protein
MKRSHSPLAAAALTIAGVLTSAVGIQAIVYQQWARREITPWHWSGSACGVDADSAGNVYVAGTSWFPRTGEDYAVLKYSPEGERLWIARYNHGYESACDLELDAQGNIYVSGSSQRSSNNMDYAIAKFNSDGQQLWAARYAGPAGEDEWATDMALDDEGNCYVTGYSWAPDTHWDCLTIKYDSQGVEQWVARYNGLANGHDRGYALAVDGMGNVCVTGSCDSQPGSSVNVDYLTLKYDALGVQQWVTLYDGTASDDDHAYVLALDENANVYITGTSPGAGTNEDCVTIKYNPAGIEQWVARYDSPGHGYDSGSQLKLDSEGDVIVMGGSGGPGYNNSLLLKYNADGLLQWLKTLSWIGTNSLELDANQNIYLAGNKPTPSLGISDGAVAKYDPQGNLQWLAWYGDDDSYERSDYLAVDAEDNVITTGVFFWPEYGGGDYLTIKYNQIDGNLIVGMVPQISPIQIPAGGGRFSYHLMAINNVTDSLAVDFWWQMIFPGPDPRDQWIGPIQEILLLDSTAWMRTQSMPAIAPAGTYQYIVYAGDYPDLIWASDTLIVEKLPAGNGLKVDGWNLHGAAEPVADLESYPKAFILHPCHPNPFNPTSVISFELRAASFVKLRVLNISGRLVATLVDGWRGAGVHQVTFDGSALSSGIYLYRITAGSWSASEKMMLLK